MLNRDNHAQQSGVSRRIVLSGAAWAAPAIVVASAVPAAANSLLLCDPVTLGVGGVAIDNGYTRDSDALGGNGAIVQGQGGPDLAPFAVTSAMGSRVGPVMASDGNAALSTGAQGIKLNSVPPAGQGVASRNFDGDFESTMTFEFNPPVSDVHFVIYHVTWWDGHREYVRAAAANGDPLEPISDGVGSSLEAQSHGGNTWYAKTSSANNVPSTGTDAGHAVRYYIPGLVTEFTVHMVRPANSGDVGGVTVGLVGLTPNPLFCQ